MKFSFSDEQVEFRTALRRFLSDTSPSVETRRLMETDIGYDADVWRQMSQDLGLTAIHIPESYGGQGFGVSELAIATEEMGRALLCAPYFASTVLGATAIMHAGSEDQKQTLLPGIADPLPLPLPISSPRRPAASATWLISKFSGTDPCCRKEPRRRARAEPAILAFP